MVFNVYLKFYLFGMEIYWELSLGPLHWERRALALDHEGKSHTVKPLDPVFPLLLLPLNWPWCFPVSCGILALWPLLGGLGYQQSFKK